MKTHCLTCLFLVSSLADLWCQTPELDQSVFGAGPFISTDRSPWALYRNMAGLADSELWQVTLGYRRPYGLPELQSISWGMVLPLKPVIGVSLYQSGSHVFRSQQFALNTAYGLNRIRLGFRIEYWRLNFMALEPLNGFSADLGLQAEISDHLLLGLFFSNPAQTKIRDEQIFPVIWATGIQYHPSNNLVTTLEAAHRSAEVLELKIGVEYRIKEKLKVRTGFNSYGRQSFFGVAFMVWSFELDYAVSFHLDLGPVHQVGINYTRQ